MRIAHLSDVHILERRHVPGARLGVRFLSAGRRLDPHGRARRFTRALAAARRSGAAHVIVSGDLTESGTPEQFEELALLLHAAPFRPDEITLVPGNHDAYGEVGEWKRAIEGPLRAFAPTSATTAGKVVDRGDLWIMPVDVTCPQPITRSAGELADGDAEAVERRFRDPAASKRAVALVQHHPPYAHAMGAWQWIDGLRGAERLVDSLQRAPQVQVLHGHLHKSTDRALPREEGAVGVDARASSLAPRAFGAPAIVEDDDDRPRVRIYELEDGALRSAGLA